MLCGFMFGPDRCRMGWGSDRIQDSDWSCVPSIMRVHFSNGCTHLKHFLVGVLFLSFVVLSFVVSWLFFLVFIINGCLAVMAFTGMSGLRCEPHLPHALLLEEYTTSQQMACYAKAKPDMFLFLFLKRNGDQQPTLEDS